VEVAAFDEGLVIAGVTTFVIGYITQLILAGSALTSDNTRSEFESDLGYYASPGYAYDILDRDTGRVFARFEDYSCRNAVGGTLLVPVVGVILSAATHADCRVPHYYSEDGRLGFDHTHDVDNTAELLGAIPGALAQAIGLISFIIGITARPRSIRVEPSALAVDVGTTRVALASNAPGANLGGLSLRLDF
jgi:hypothetical protein